MNSAFHLCPVVEGDGDEEAIPSLLHKLFPPDFNLRVERPYRIPKGKFIEKHEERRACLEIARRWAADKDKSGVLVLLDADENCCRDFVRGDQAKAVRADMQKILGDIPHFFALAEKGYESWLVAGFGGDQSNPKNWLKNQFGKYSKIPDQKKLTSSPEFNIKQAYEINVSFRRFRDRVLALPGKAA